MMWWCGCLQYNRTYGRRPAIFYDFAAAAAALSSLCLAAQKKVYLFDKEFVPGGHFINKRLAIFPLSELTPCHSHNYYCYTIADVGW